MLFKELNQNIKNYKILLQSSKETEQINALKQLIQNAQQQMLKLQSQSQQSSASSSINQNQTQKNLIDIFFFYCKLSYSNGQANDFDRIAYDTSVMSIGKFIIFCRQFNIMEQKPQKIQRSISKKNHKWWLNEQYQEDRKQFFSQQDQRIRKNLSRQDLVNLFKKIANKEINYWEFEQLLRLLAEALNKDYNLFLIEDLHIQTKEYKNYLKSLNTAFFCYEEKGKRLLPGYEQYLFKNPLNQQQKKQFIQKWQLLSNKQNAQISTRKQSKSINNLSQPKLEKSNQLQENYMKKRQQSQIDQPKEFKISWQNLDKLTFKQLDNDFKPYDLIEDDHDDEDKFYLQKFLLEPEKQRDKERNMKLNEQLVNYGQQNMLQNIAPPVFPDQMNKYYLIAKKYGNKGSNKQINQTQFNENSKQQIIYIKPRINV